MPAPDDVPTSRRRREELLLEEVALGNTRLISWQTATGEQARGAVLLPANYRDGQRVPLITHVYPGSSLSNELHEWDPLFGYPASPAPGQPWLCGTDARYPS